MTVVLVDDQHLGAILRGQLAHGLRSAHLYTTGYWYVRLCQAVLGAEERTSVLSRPFAELPEHLRERALGALLELPAEIGLASLRDLAPTIARLRPRHQLNILGMEALAAAVRLEATVRLSASSPLLERALTQGALRHGHACLNRPSDPDRRSPGAGSGGDCPHNLDRAEPSTPPGRVPGDGEGASVRGRYATEAVRRCREATAGGPQLGFPPGSPAVAMPRQPKARHTAQPRARRQVASSAANGQAAWKRSIAS